MNDPDPPSDSKPKMPRADAEAMIKLMDQELAMQRAKRAVGSENEHHTGRWLALLFVIFVLLGAVAWGFWKLNEIKPPPKGPTPTTAPRK